MSDKEKKVWLQMLICVWGWPLFGVILIGFFPGPKALEGVTPIAGTVLVLTATYLLILSWRAAYLSGRGRR